jgi:ABC-type multidrug transport system permease subunit
MKAVAVALKTLREAAREPQIALLFICFPALLCVVYFSAFNQGPASMSSLLRLIVINQDAGPMGSRLVDALRGERFEGQPAYSIREGISEADAVTRLQEGASSLLVVIPEDFSRRLGARPAWPAIVRVRSDQLSEYAEMARTFLDGSLARFSRELDPSLPAPSASYEMLPGTGTSNDFATSIPGVIVFGVLIGILTSALMLTRETERDTILRLGLSGVSPVGYFTGFVAAQTVVTFVQVGVTYGALLALGFKPVGSLAAAAPFLLLTSLCATACGMATAAFARTDGGAMSVSMIFLAPLAFLSGAVFPIGDAPLFVLGGISVGMTHLLPSRHASKALTDILVFGAGLGDELYEILALAGLTAAYIAVGAWLYGLRRFAAARGARGRVRH